jgi:rhomboid protease GluP
MEECNMKVICMKQEMKIPVMTIILVAVNVLVFAYVELAGSSEDVEFMLQMGASYEPYITGNHEYYRLITHCFLHYGVDHLMNNMISLLVLGYSLENVLGRWRYLFLYLFSGILAGISSLVYVYACTPAGQEPVSCGASGAIYGLMGALLVLLIIGNRGHRSTQVPRYLLFIGISLYSGIQDKSIDNAAHIGGFLTGFLVCLMMCHKKKMEVYYES